MVLSTIIRKAISKLNKYKRQLRHGMKIKKAVQSSRRETQLCNKRT